jgi:ribosome maturation factor RimP
VLTDDLIRDALRKDKALREGRIPGDDLGSEEAGEPSGEVASGEAEDKE